MHVPDRGARNARRAVGGALAVLTLAADVSLTPRMAAAQDRLLGVRAVGVGAGGETVSFGNGVWESPLAGQDSIRVRSASQLSIPLTFAIPVMRFVTVDATAVHVNGTVHYARPDRAGVLHETHASLDGLSDVRLRVTGRLFDDRLVVTGGLNAPTGRTSLDSAQLLAVRVLAAPALGFGAPPIGAGPSGTLGVLAAHNVGQWAVAAGASYEHRGTYAPVTALVAGLTSLDFTPGDVVRLSLAGDGLLARGRLTASLATDFYQRDRLRGGGVIGADAVSSGGATASTGTATIATVQLGPVVSADVQYNAPAPVLRELVLYGSAQYRTPYARDGIRVRNSAATYLNSGVRTVIPLATGRDAFVGGDVRYSTGIPTGGGLTTAFYTTGGVTAGLSQRVGRRLTAQPYVRAQIGRIVGRGIDRGHNAIFRGLSAGFTLLSRF